MSTSPRPGTAPGNARPGPLAVEGDTCWRRVRAGRFKVLVDAAAYFATLQAALEQARTSILILGWDVDSR